MHKVRQAKIEDLNFIVDLFNKYRVFYEKESDIKKTTQFISDRLLYNDSKIFVSETAENEIVGFVQLYPIFSSTKMQRLWLLNDLYVDKRYRGKGLSKKLIEEAQELCKKTNACGLLLETAKSNHIGNQLYPKMGFSLDSEHNYYTWENI